MKIIVTKNEYIMMEDGSIYIDLNITNQPVQQETPKNVDHFESGKKYRLLKDSCYMDKHRRILCSIDCRYVGIKGEYYYFDNATKVSNGDPYGSGAVKMEPEEINFDLIAEI